jgi:hypothetical protein
MTNEDWIERRRVDEFSMRFVARGAATAAKFVWEFVEQNKKYSRSFRIWRVVNGVRNAKDIREEATERTRMFGRRR